MTINARRFFSVFALLCAVLQGAWAETIQITYAYRYYEVNEETHELMLHTDGVHTATPLTNSNYTLESGWYVLSGNVNYNNRINVVGDDVNIILCDQCTLSAPRGIFVNPSAKLTIYAQSDGDGMGKIVAKGNGGEWAAIGGNNGRDAGTLIIHGGNINAEATNDNSAGIGGGNGENSGMKEITILGGKVVAKSKNNGAGIGGAKRNNHVGTINIYNGTVTATGSKNGAGIGSSEDRDSWPVNIYGGTIKAYGGGGAAGIGAGYAGSGSDITIYNGTVHAEGGCNGAGIGGGGFFRGGGDAGNITILGGSVEAKGYSTGAGIGGGGYGNGGNIVIKNAYVKAWGSMDFICSFSRAIGAGYAGVPGTIVIDNAVVDLTNDFRKTTFGDDNCKMMNGNVTLGKLLSVKIKFDDGSSRITNYNNRVSECCETDCNSLRIEACQHGKYNYALGDFPEEHVTHCMYCEYTTNPQRHINNGEGKCTICGYSTLVHTITVYKAAENSMGYDEGVQYSVIPGQAFELPYIVNRTLPDYMLFEGWLQDPETTPDTWETTSADGLLEMGSFIRPQANVNLYARYSYRYGEEWTWTDNYDWATMKLINLENDQVLATLAANVTATRVEPSAEAPGSITYTARTSFIRPSDGHEFTFVDERVVPLYIDVSLDEDDNTATLSDNIDAVANVTLTGRTFLTDDKWNTLCLPFDLYDADAGISDEDVGGADGLFFTGTPFQGATVKELASVQFNNTTGRLTLNFVDAPAIRAGRPYLIKWNGNVADDLQFPTFTGVTISNEVDDQTFHVDEEKAVVFRGSFVRHTCADENPGILYLNDTNKLYRPSANASIGAQRAFFELSGDGFSENVRSFVLNFGDSEATDIVEVQGNSSRLSGWYSLDGVRLSGKPTAKGIYVHGGRKFVVR